MLKPVACVVMDIEGTTTAIEFVTGALYPYARERMPDFIRRRRGETDVAAIVDEVRQLAGVWNDEAVLAQRLIYGHTVDGDLGALLSGCFDTRVGHQREKVSYRHIADAIGTRPERILFLSDVREEQDAARDAGYQTVWLVRSGAPALAVGHRRAARFDEILL